MIGLSAPQLGHSVRLIAYQIQDKALIKERNLSKHVPLTFLVNPKIISKSGIKGELVEREWCESMPQYSGLVKRAEAIHVHALDLEGKLVDKKYSGLLARIIQHEMDHLEGINFTDIMEKKSLQHDSLIK